MERINWTDDYSEMTDADSREIPDQQYRTAGTIAVIAIAAFGGILVLLNSISGSNIFPSATILAGERISSNADSTRTTSGIPPSRLVLSRTRPLDTIYTTDSLYLEVNLTRQDVTVHTRSGVSRTFLISSGTPAIREGMATPSGVFTVQNMTPMALSRQFNNAKLHHWVGIQGGVGFHGLDGSGYYGYLGKRPSSHGCVRMSREEISQMYSMVHPGALIVVHYGHPARVVAFCDPQDTVGAQLIDSASVYNRNLGRERLQTLMDGTMWTNPQPRLVHVARQRLRWGMPIGNARDIPKQKIPEGISFSAQAHPVLTARADLAFAAVRSVGVGRALLTADSIDRMRMDSLHASEQAEPEYGE